MLNNLSNKIREKNILKLFLGGEGGEKKSFYKYAFVQPTFLFHGHHTYFYTKLQRQLAFKLCSLLNRAMTTILA
mgnify:CR=1 FL=1